MRRALKLHPDSQCMAVRRIDVDIARPRPGRLTLHYIVTGTIGDLRLPSLTAPARADELWRHTCFEAFVRVPTGAGYYEFNFAPSTQWAAYAFGAHRSGMRVADEVGTPAFDIRSDAQCYELEVSLALDRLAGLAGDAPWRLNLSAVIQEAGGGKSWWASAHPPGAADFHHPDCFVLELPAA